MRKGHEKITFADSFGRVSAILVRTAFISSCASSETSRSVQALVTLPRETLSGANSSFGTYSKLPPHLPYDLQRLFSPFFFFKNFFFPLVCKSCLIAHINKIWWGLQSFCLGKNTWWNVRPHWFSYQQSYHFIKTVIVLTTHIYWGGVYEYCKVLFHKSFIAKEFHSS